MSAIFTFTQGDWEVHGQWIVRNLRGRHEGICMLLDGPPSRPRGEVVANSRLITAAPDMCRALQFAITENPAEALDQGRALRRLHSINAAMEAALFAATGGTK